MEIIDSFEKLYDIWKAYNKKKEINFYEFKQQVYDWNSKYCHYRGTSAEILRNRRKEIKNLPLLRWVRLDFIGIGMIKHAYVLGKPENTSLEIVVMPIYYDGDPNNPRKITHDDHADDPSLKEFSFEIDKNFDLDTDIRVFLVTEPYESLGKLFSISDPYESLGKPFSISDYFELEVDDVIEKNQPVYISYFDPEKIPKNSVDITPNYDIFGVITRASRNETVMVIKPIMIGGLPQPKEPKEFKIYVPMWAHDRIWLLEGEGDLKGFKESIFFNRFREMIMRLNGFILTPVYNNISGDNPEFKLNEEKIKIEISDFDLKLGGNSELYIKLSENLWIHNTNFDISMSKLPGQNEYLEFSKKPHLYGYVENLGENINGLQQEKTDLERIQPHPLNIQHLIDRYNYILNVLLQKKPILLPEDPEEPEEESEEESEEEEETISEQLVKAHTKIVQLETLLENTQQQNLNLIQDNETHRQNELKLKNQIIELTAKNRSLKIQIQQLKETPGEIPPVFVEEEQIIELRAFIANAQQKLTNLHKQVIDEIEKREQSDIPTEKEENLKKEILITERSIKIWINQIFDIEKQSTT